MRFTTRYSREAEKVFARLDQTMRRRVDGRLEDLEVEVAAWRRCPVSGCRFVRFSTFAF